MPHGRATSQPEARRPTALCRWGLAAALMAQAPFALAQSAPPPDRIPLVTGLILGSVLHAPIGEREDLLEIGSADSTGVHYAWHERTIIDGDTTTGFRRRFVSANDLAGAPRFDSVFGTDEQKRPGFTAVSLSSAVYRQLRDAGSAPFSMIVNREPGGPKAGDVPSLGAMFGPGRERYKGTLTRVSPQPERFPLLLNGSRATVPAMHVKGSFTAGLRRSEWDLWVQADSAHPLVLKSVLEEKVFQMVRADLPVTKTPGPGTTADGGMLAEELKARCRVELPGVYFAFGTATIDPISDRALAQLARSLAGHPDWKFTVEGHTDSVGTDEANRSLSLRRAEAVRARLAEQHGLNTRAWGAMGYGATRPKESNATIEGRARNRRVELVRDCR
ncbi:MAG TPA: OmpA family protein [Gemmatimonadales bacterium]|nr:OmpA family protein [Gemmatimonadales bacterium]